MDATSLTVPIAALAGLLGVALTAGINWGMTTRRMKDLERQTEEHAKEIAEIKQQRETLTLDVQSVKQELGYIRHAVDRMLERLLSKE